MIEKMLIDGEWCAAADGAVDDVVNKTDNSLLTTVPAAGKPDVLRAVAAAQEGKRRMAELPAYERSAILQRTADAIEQRKEELSQLLTRENGRTLREIRTEIDATVRIFRGYAEEAKRLLGRTTPLDTIPGHENSLAVTIRQPRGVVVAIAPFNYPAELWSHKVAGGLAAGNAVITKPPEECPLVIIEITKIMEAAGLPRAAHQLVTGRGETAGVELVRAEGVDMIAMTGSTAAGRDILHGAADGLKKVHLELGGNDATIVCEDADLSAVADDLIKGRFTSGNGQICCAVKRVFVERAALPRLKEILLEKTGRLHLGDPLDDATDIGPLITATAAERVQAQVSRAVENGARLLTGGHHKGALFEPTILDGPDDGNDLYQEEIFGPVLPLIGFDDFDRALEMVNASPYGLQAAIYSRDIGRIMRAFKVLEVGTVVVNHSTAIRLETLPFGGSKASGNAREGIHDTLLEMTEQKTLLMNGVFA